MFMHIDTIIFDLDNTLTNRAASIRKFSQQFLLDYRQYLQPHMTLDALHEVIRVGDGGGYRPKAELFREMQTELAWIDIPPTLEALAAYWYRVSAETMQLRDDVHATLKALQQRGYLLGMVTNGQTPVQNATIDATQLRDYFSTIIISEECGLRKPAPEIFQLALARLGKSANSAVYIGDNPVADVQGARSAGLKSIWFSDGNAWSDDLQPPDDQIDQIPQLLEILK